MLAITIISIGKIKTPYWREAVSEYGKRLGPYIKIKNYELRALSFSETNKEQVKKKESATIQSLLDSHSLENVYLLSEGGRAYDSLELAAFLNANLKTTLIIAGSLGFDSEFSSRYPKLSLSPLTFPHELTKVILLEQLYRASAILNNKKYHY